MNNDVALITDHTEELHYYLCFAPIFFPKLKPLRHHLLKIDIRLAQSRLRQLLDLALHWSGFFESRLSVSSSSAKSGASK